MFYISLCGKHIAAGCVRRARREREIARTERDHRVRETKAREREKEKERERERERESERERERPLRARERESAERALLLFKRRGLVSPPKIQVKKRKK